LYSYLQEDNFVRFLVPFVINTSDLTERVKEEFSNLVDGPTEYVITEVVGRMFDSIGEPYLRLRVKRFCGLRYT
jgi:hypothetical protein